MAKGLSKACRVDKVSSGAYPPFNLWIRRCASLSTLRPTAHELFKRGWQTVRRLSGDDGYERYLEHHAAAHPGIPTLSRSAWFAEQQKQKWSGINRCC